MTTIVAPPRIPDPVDRTPRWTVSIIILITLTALSLRLYRLQSNGFWYDECIAADVSVGRGFAFLNIPTGVLFDAPPDAAGLRSLGPWHGTWAKVTGDFHPPLYMLVLRLWRGMLGSSDLALRLPSVLFSVGCMPLLWLIGRELIGPTAGLWAAALLAVSGEELFLAQQVRPYTMAEFLTLCGLLAAARIERRGWSMRRGIILAGATLAMMLTHYFALGVAVALGLHAATRISGEARRKVLIALASSGMIFVAVWGPFTAGVVPVLSGKSWLDDNQPGHISRTLRAFLETPLHLLGRPYDPPLLAELLLLGAVLIIPLLIARGQSRRRGLLLPWMAFVFAACVPLILDLSRNTTLLAWTRYSILAAPPLYLLLAGVTASLQSRWLRHVIPAGALLSCLAALPHAYEPQYADWRALMKPITGSQDAAPVVFLGRIKDVPSSWPSVDEFYGCAARYLPSGHPVMLLDQELSKKLAGDLRARGDFWAVISWGEDVGRRLPGAEVDPSVPRLTEAPLGGVQKMRWISDTVQPTSTGSGSTTTTESSNR